MTKEHELRAYKHFKELLKSPMKKPWKANVQHGIDSILIRHPEFADIKEDISEEKELDMQPSDTDLKNVKKELKKKRK